jgi:uncharacterized membrane protein YoaK (UPF0700 family)
MFWVAPIIGAVIGGVLYRWLGEEKALSPSPAVLQSTV